MPSEIIGNFDGINVCVPELYCSKDFSRKTVTNYSGKSKHVTSVVCQQNGKRYTCRGFPRFAYLPNNDRGRHVST